MAAAIPVVALSLQLDPDYRSSYALLEQGEHYAIYDAGVKAYPAATFLVRTSGEPINLGADMQPFLDTTRLWEFIEANDIPVKADAPREVYLYNWVDGAQGAMVFDVGVVVEDHIGELPAAAGFVVKRYPAMKFASLVYEGPFPHEPDSGWDRILWEDRAKASGHVYTERLYRELYHTYDFAGTPPRHVTEVQIEIE